MAHSPKHILLVGAGHAHLGVLRDCGTWGHRVTVVSPGDFWYSGLATGMLGGQHAIDDDRVDVPALCRRVGAAFVRDEMTGLDASAKVVRLKSGRVLGYDVLSLDIGSEVRSLPGAEPFHPELFTAKPISRLADLRRKIETGPVYRMAVIGGGYTGVECALNLAPLMGKVNGANEPAEQVVLFTGPDGPARRLPQRARSVLLRRLRKAGVHPVRQRVIAVREAEQREADEMGRLDVRIELNASELMSAGLGFDEVLLATGLHPPAPVGKLGLPTTESGRLALRNTLQVEGQHNVFAAGDCATLSDRELPKNGVVAVRQAEVLARNLPAAAEGRELKVYKPQKHHLLILNLGDGTGLAVRGRWHYHGRLALWLKNRIDRRWLNGLRSGKEVES